MTSGLGGCNIPRPGTDSACVGSSSSFPNSGVQSMSGCGCISVSSCCCCCAVVCGKPRSSTPVSMCERLASSAGEGCHVLLSSLPPSIAGRLRFKNLNREGQVGWNLEVVKIWQGECGSSPTFASEFVAASSDAGDTTPWPDTYSQLKYASASDDVLKCSLYLKIFQFGVLNPQPCNHMLTYHYRHNAVALSPGAYPFVRQHYWRIQNNAHNRQATQKETCEKLSFPAPCQSKVPYSM